MLYVKAALHRFCPPRSSLRNAVPQVANRAALSGAHKLASSLQQNFMIYLRSGQPVYQAG